MKHNTKDKDKVLKWINEQFSFFQFDSDPVYKTTLYFKLDNPEYDPEIEVYVRKTTEEMEFGFEATQWDGYMPAPYPSIYPKYSTSLDSLRSLEEEEMKEKILELLMKTINSRKRQYRKCQFCGKKVAKQHRFNKSTCHRCASKHFGIVY
jgi:NADH pyrophosphatase NudC (nudix superfamily)